MAYIIEFDNYWITDTNPLLGDPARTVIKDSAKKYKKRQSAEKALKKITQDNFHRYKGKVHGKVVECGNQ